MASDISGKACINFFLYVTSEDCSVKFREAVESGDPDIVKNVHEGSACKQRAS